MDVSNRIKELRKYKDLSQKEVAIKIGIDQAQYSRVESGKVEPTISTLEKIAQALNIPLVDFFSIEKPVDVNSFAGDMIEKLKMLDELDEEEKQCVYSVIDMAVSKKRMKEVLKSALNAA